ncbi:hypothetical protein ILUMI_10587 [Ignelater luminosus]|uniref:CLIP domain-containing serine protease n=1 Tax=Ignelater luminosus TaxID=2038154 RepID=A0A8K0D246_IGNLU|nr:hypothetical protein ILUMI_10587 [Ignelater luminosus]
MFTFKTLVCFIYWFGCGVLSSEISFTENVDEHCRTPDNAVGKCVSIKDCTYLHDFAKTHPKTHENIEYIKKFHCGFEGIISKVCCSAPNETKSLASIEEKLGESTTKVFAIYVIAVNLLPNRSVCGLHFDRRVVGGKIADPQEFPWMALIEYETKNGKQFLCGGSLINSRYVLTAAHCLEENLVSVRLGEYDLDKEVDCFDEESIDCLDKPIDVKVQEQIPHEQFDLKIGNYLHDIALLRLSEDILYSDSIMPICLPSEEILNLSNKVKTTVAGWGVKSKTRSALKLKAELHLVPNIECSSVYERKTRLKIGEGQICAVGMKGVDACKGDSGNALMFHDKRADEQNFIAIGVVSFGLGCGTQNVPAVFTRVSSYIQWIIDHIKE